MKKKSKPVPHQARTSIFLPRSSHRLMPPSARRQPKSSNEPIHINNPPDVTLTCVPGFQEPPIARFFEPYFTPPVTYPISIAQSLRFQHRTPRSSKAPRLASTNQERACTRIESKGLCKPERGGPSKKPKKRPQGESVPDIPLGATG